jgi:hypothetical protein
MIERTKKKKKKKEKNSSDSILQLTGIQHRGVALLAHDDHARA